jgi:transcriptional regulator with XRE-family HTH domain
MRADGLATYETWDLKGPVVPPRSRLFNLSPIGLGTPMVECMTSYFSRLAQAHCLSPGALTQYELMPRGAGARNMFSCKIRARTHTSGINGKDSVAANFVSVLGKLTSRRDLKYLTMIPWKSLLPSKFLMRNVAAWCPDCLMGWEQSGKPVYVPLLWTLEVVKFCPYHRRAARLTCPHCKRPQGVLGQRSRVGFCARCRRSLASESGKEDSACYSPLRQETPEWEIWVVNQMVRLIEAGLHDPPLLTREQFSELIRTATDIVGLSEFARILGVSATAVYEWQIHGVQPTLVLYLRVARVLNVPLVDLLTGRVTPAKIRSLCLTGLPHWQNVWAPRRSTFNNKEAARQVKAALKEVPPPSLMAFAKRYRYTHRILRKYLPDQCQAIQQRYREHCAACIEQRRAARIVEFRRVALQLHDGGTELTLNRILTRMSTTQGLGFAIARDLLAEIRREIANRKPTGKPCGKIRKHFARRSPQAGQIMEALTLP